MQQNLQRAILVNVIPHERDKSEAMAEFDELVRLVETYGGMVVLKILQKRGRPSSSTFLGEGKAREVAQLVKDLRIDVVVINGFLKPNQSNNLVNIIPCEVLDRFEMILKIFEKHANTPEAKLQLQIAYNKYEFPKLFGRGAALSQQASGMAARTAVSTGAGRRAARGPGEKILEVKRRHLRSEIQNLEEKLSKFRNVRSLQRERRRRQDFITIALVGYTNSGKSSLMRALTKKKNILVENKLFTTLDTRLGEIYIGQSSAPDAANWRQIEATAENRRPKILLADTIGFIKNLPPLLFSSFLATLEEVKEADLLLHVVDASDPEAEEKIATVEEILAQLGCSAKPKIYVFNKIDIARKEVLIDLADKFSGIPSVFVSALKDQNADELTGKINGMLLTLGTPARN